MLAGIPHYHSFVEGLTYVVISKMRQKKENSTVMIKKAVTSFIIVVIITWTVKFAFVLMLEHDVRGIQT